MRTPAVILALLIIVPASAQTGPKVTIVPAPPNPFQYEKTKYHWKKFITATVFWIGEKPTQNNPTPNNKSSWDQNWQQNYGGYDNPDPASRRGYVPKGFTPRLNPFYVALPYNDCINHKAHKPEAARAIPWFKHYRPRPGQTVCKGRWVQIVSNKRVCYAQWEDCGPFTTDDWEYVFGNKKPKNTKNQNAGIDISPAVRDFLQVGNKVQCHWRFIEFSQIPRGPWSKYGTNNPFVNYKANPDLIAKERFLEYLRKKKLRAYGR